MRALRCKRVNTRKASSILLFYFPEPALQAHSALLTRASLRAPHPCIQHAQAIEIELMFPLRSRARTLQTGRVNPDCYVAAQRVALEQNPSALRMPTASSVRLSERKRRLADTRKLS